MNWIPLISEDQLDTIDELSAQTGIKGVLLFKHSSRCGISATALNRLERSFDYPPSEMPAYFVDILKYRALSDKISARYNVPHESPQLLLIKNRACKYTTSHTGISFADLREVANS